METKNESGETPHECESDTQENAKIIRMKTGLDYKNVCECDDVDCELNHKPRITFKSTTQKMRTPHKISFTAFNNKCSKCYFLKMFEYNKDSREVIIDCAIGVCSVIV